MLQLKNLPKLINYSLFFIFFTNKFITFFYLIKVSNMLIFQTKIAFIVSYFTMFDIFLYGLLKGYKIFLEIYGAGYKIKLINIKKKFGLILRIGYSHLIYINLLKNFRISFFNKFIICIYTNQLFYLQNKLYFFTFNKKKSIYKKKGIFWKNKIVVLKKNKKLKF